MLSEEGSAVALTDDFNTAVALATYGFPHRLERLRNEATGDVVSHLFHLEPSAVNFIPTVPGEVPTFVGAESSPVGASTFLRVLRSNILQQSDPCHPLLDVLHALHIYECVRSFMERARPFRIALVGGGRGRCSLLPGRDPAADNAGAFVETDQLELAVALIRLGVPLLRCEGVAPYRRLVLAATGYPVGHTGAWAAIDGSCDAAKLATAITDGSLLRTDPAHPALWAIIGLRNRRAMKREMNGQKIPLLLHNPRSHDWARRKRSSIVPGEATGKQIDRARELYRR